MAKINDLTANLKKALLAKITKDSTKEQIDAINAEVAQIDAIDAEANGIIADKQAITEMYANAVKNSGSKTEINDGAGENEVTPKSLEECINEVVNKKDSNK